MTIEVKTISNQERIRLLKCITGQDINCHAQLQSYHFGTNYKTEIRDFIIEDKPSFADKINEPWEKFYNDYLIEKCDDVTAPESGIDIKSGTPMGLLLALTYSTDIN